ncbi:MAG TPA: twin-arginine translocase TatA/TatE family subunit [Candidatus Binatia bacterium]|nr:twin-arginine translocase TatA/TatE family subunit [Candidatus Binatia bacterium]
MSFSETIFLFFLALIIFGPKKLPEMARQAGKLLAELRRASNEFRSQIEAEIAHIEVQKNAPAASSPPPGAVAGLTPNSGTGASAASATLAAAADPVNGGSSEPTHAAESPTQAVANPTVTTSQETHV